MTMLLADLALGLVIYLGFQIYTLIRSPLVAIEAWSVSYLLGIGTFTFVLFLANLVGIPYNVWPASLILLSLISSIILFKVLTRHPKKLQALQLWPSWQFLKRIKTFSLTEKAVFAVIIAIISWALILSSYWPVSDWDAIVLYDFRAKTMVETGFMQSGLDMGYFLGYPLLTSLGHAWLYMWGHQYPGSIHSLFYVSFVGAFYFMIRKKMPRLAALLWTLVFSLSASLFDHAMMTYTNLAYTVYLVTGYFYLFEWEKDQKKSTLVLSALLVGLSTWTRSAEPFWLVMIVWACGLAVLHRQWWAGLTYPLLVNLIRYPWQFFEKWHLRGPGKLVESVPQVVDGFFERFTLNTVPQVVAYFWHNVIYPNRQMYLLFALTTLLMVWRSSTQRKIDRIEVLVWAAIGANLLLTLGGIYYFSLYYQDWVNIGGSALRMSLFFGPLILYFVAQVTSRTHFKNLKRSK